MDDKVKEQIFKILLPHATYKRESDYEMINQILSIPEIARAMEYYRLMHSPGHDVDKYYRE